jgi:hypothetical protein
LRIFQEAPHHEDHLVHTDEDLLFLTTEEKNAILQHVPLTKGIEARLRFAVHARGGVEVRLSDEEFDILMRRTVAVIAKTDDSALIAVLSGLFDRIRPRVDDTVPETFDRSVFPEELPDEICQEIHTLLRNGDFQSMDEAFQAVQGLLMRHNAVPRSDLMGLTPEQGFQLLGNGWGEANSAIQIRDDMPAEALSESLYFRRGTIMLRLLDEADGAALTPKKFLNRKWVQRLVQAFAEPEDEHPLEERWLKSIAEQRCPPVHYVRILLEESRLIRVFKGKLVLTAAGRKCLDPARAGELQALLFRTMVTRFNLAYFDGAPDYPEVQETYPYIVYVLGRVAREPVPLAEAQKAAYLPGVAEVFAVYEHFSHADFVFHSRVLRPLRDFGLLRVTPDDANASTPKDERRVQITPLFDHMIAFTFAESPLEN